MRVTFITGNRAKADFMAKFLGQPLGHRKIDLDEIQSLDLKEIAEHKVEQAYEAVKGPVLVEDMGLYFHAMGQLPGVFIKWFLQEIGNDGLCRTLNVYDDRSATAKICFAYYDGQKMEFFEGEVAGRIANRPRGNNGFGWDPIFIPEGAGKTYAEMNEAETERFSLRTTTVFPQIKEFLSGLDSNKA